MHIPTAHLLPSTMDCFGPILCGFSSMDLTQDNDEQQTEMHIPTAHILCANNRYNLLCVT